jgi:hypothetical protein
MQSQNPELTSIGIWRNTNDAKIGGSGPWHAKARRAGYQMYERFTFKTYKMTISDGAEGIDMEEVVARCPHALKAAQAS